ncbi:MAG: hypothetical protein ACE14S_04700 [Candidatus Bathyarchaeia archaeon]
MVFNLGDLQIFIDNNLVKTYTGNYRFDFVQIGVMAPSWRPYGEFYFDDFNVQWIPGPYFTIWTDKTSYRVGDTMKVYVHAVNPSAMLPVRATIMLQLPNGNLYGPLLNMTATIPSGYDSGITLWNQFTIPNVPLGNYKWIAELWNPSTGVLISQNKWDWQLVT